jgi:N-acyl-D-amino-acid deacylase
MNNRNSCCLLWTSMFFLAAVTGLVCGQAAWAVDADIVLRGGTIYDGSGRAGMPGDVAIVGEKIVAVGQFPLGKIGRQIDCHGLVIAPGFIDLHTHSDRSIGHKSADSQNYLIQGCTTYVSGNCGGGSREVGKFLEKTDSTGRAPTSSTWCRTARCAAP